MCSLNKGLNVELDLDENVLHLFLDEWHMTPPLMIPHNSGHQKAETLWATQMRPVIDFLDSNVDAWHLDTQVLTALSDNHPLESLLLYLFRRHTLCADLNLEFQSVQAFCSAIESSYRSLPYHNVHHITSVLHLTHVIMSVSGVADIISAQQPSARSLTLAASYLTAACHDAGHFGVSNSFLVRTVHPLAEKFHDSSCNEHNHLSICLELLPIMMPSCDDKQQQQEDLYLYIRTVLIQTILASDFSKHAAICNAFARHVKEGSWMQDDARIATLQMVLKCADLGHLSFPWELHQQWVSALQEEMFQQGDLERENDLQVSPCMNRNAPGIMSTQAQFFACIAQPMFKLLVHAFPSCWPLLTRVDANLTHWKSESTTLRPEA